MNTYIWSGAFAVICLLILLAQLIGLIVLEIRDRRAAREAKKRHRLHRIAEIGFRSALMRGLVDERGNHRFRRPTGRILH
jgi:hypothetical protein